MEQIFRRVHMGPALCGLDLGDGSERAEYVCQDYILQKLGRPHRCVNIMYTLYPHDEQWPQRISQACRDMEIHFQWDYPYDDYFPYGADGQPFEQMRDIRRHGQDVLLTLTVDCSLSDEELRQVARDLRPFGRMRIRINHECAGNWFTHNRRFSYEEVGRFFVRFQRILKEEAPNVSTVFCAGMIKEDGRVEYEDEFLEAYRAADIWSADAYLALHFGWPYDVAEKESGQYTYTTVEKNFQKFEGTARRLRELCGDKPMTTAEFNADGDVTGPLAQGDSVKRFAHMVRDRKADWFQGISLYQFRDRGRLGLEIEDPNNASVGIEQPILEDYRELLFDPYFMPAMEAGEECAFPAALRWGGSEDAEGLETEIVLEGMPQFFEITVEEPLCLMIQCRDRWFYKAPQVKTVDMMPAFFKRPADPGETVKIRIFATPAEGENRQDGSEDWAVNYREKLTAPPVFRIRYEAPGVVL